MQAASGGSLLDPPGGPILELEHTFGSAKDTVSAWRCAQFTGDAWRSRCSSPPQTPGVGIRGAQGRCGQGARSPQAAASTSARGAFLHTHRDDLDELCSGGEGCLLPAEG